VSGTDRPEGASAATSNERVPRWLWIAAAAATIGLLAALWVVDYLPTHDGPLHVFLGHLENHYDDPGAGYHAYFDPGHPLTAIGFHLVFSALDAALPWRTALRVSLSLIVVTWAWGHVALCASLHRRRAVLGLLGFASGVPWVLYMGFFSFALSFGLGLLVLAAAIAGWPWTPVRRVGLAGALTIVAVAHAFGAELAGVALLALVVARAGDRRERAREVALLAVMGLPALLIASTPRSMALVSTAWLPVRLLATTLPRMFLPGPLWRAWPPVLLGLAGIVAALVRARRRRLTAPDAAVLAVGAACFVAAVALPLHHSHWEFLSPRVLPPAILLGAALVPVEQLSTRSRRALSGGLAAFTALSLGFAIHTSVSLRARVDDAMSGLSLPIHRDGPRLWALIPAEALDGGEAPIPYHEPLRNIGALYCVEQGGICPYLFAGSPSLHAFVYSEEGKARYPKALDLGYYEDRRTLEPARRSEIMTLLAQTAGPFQDVIMVGRPADGDTLVERGLVASYRRGGLFMGHFVGCPVHFDVKTPAVPDVVVSLEYGFDPGRPAPLRVVLGAKKPGEPLRFAPSIALCGPAWLRGALLTEGAPDPSVRPHFCAGADQEGKLQVVARPGAVFACRLDEGP
jgi:hypothetical protein